MTGARTKPDGPEAGERVQVTPDWRPSTEGGIGRAKPLKNRRTRSGKGTLNAIRAAKCMNGCRLCPTAVGIEPHHLIPRARGGLWHFDNICGLCHDCHEKVTRNDPEKLAALAAALTDSEYAYVHDELGEGALERLFHVRYERAY